MLWGEFDTQCSSKVGKALWFGRRTINVVNLTLRFQCCNNIVNTTFTVHRELNLLSNVEEALEQSCNFDVLTSTSLQSCVLVARRYHLLQPCHNVVCLLRTLIKTLLKIVWLCQMKVFMVSNLSEKVLSKEDYCFI